VEWPIDAARPEGQTVSCRNRPRGFVIAAARGSRRRSMIKPQAFGLALLLSATCSVICDIEIDTAPIGI